MIGKILVSPRKIFLYALSLASWLILDLDAQAFDDKKNILVIHSYHSEFSWTQKEKEGIDSGFEKSRHDVDVYHEFLDAKRYPKLQHSFNFFDTLTNKYKDTSFDALMIADDPGLNFYLSVRDKYFSDVPVVFLGINNIQEKLLNVPWLTGVFENRDLVETVIEASRQMETNNVIVLGDSSETGLANLQKLKKLRKNPDAPINIVVVQDLVSDDIESTLEPYPDNWPIFLAGQLRNESADGSLIAYQEEILILRSQIPNPIYTDSGFRMRPNVVGGKILEGNFHARLAVRLAERILEGISVNNIPPVLISMNQWEFDYRELKRFGINLKSLPPDSKVVNQQPSFYSQYKHLVWITFGSFLVTLVIILLLAEVIRRRSIEEKRLRENQNRYRAFAEAGANVFWELNQYLKFTYISDEALVLNGQHSIPLLGESLHSIVSQDDTLDFDWERFLQAFKTCQPIQDFIFRSHYGKESVRIFKINGTPIFDTQDNFLGYRGIQREITQEYKLADNMAYQATHDWLTGLVNRYEFNDRLQEIIQDCCVRGNQAVLCYIDLDQFKIVNDTAGHAVGDQLLIEISTLFQKTIRDSDILSRLGGDEFGLILRNCTLKSAQVICKLLLSNLQGYRFYWGTSRFSLGCSIGVVPISVDSGELVDVLSRADLACYKAKKSGRGRVYIDTPGELGLDSDKNLMNHIANLTQYIEEDRFFLVQQKIQSLFPTGHQGNHFEILIRFKDKNSTVMSPASFIPAMEQYGVITIIDRWVIETVLKKFSYMNSDMLISINISGISLGDESFLEYTIQQLKKSQLPATCLCFEITETAAISHLEDAKKFIHTFQALGAKFALDDFGSGLSSFGYLKTLPVDFLKIDGSLIKNIVRDPSDLSIVRCLNDVAHMLDMQTIAEFVEDRQTLECLKTLGTDYVQGYGIAKPKPLETVHKSL